MGEITVSAPGRVCLFGEHQDYLGLPVIAAALNIRNTMTGRTTRDGAISIIDKKLGRSANFRVDEIDYTGDDFDYLRAVVKVLMDDAHGEITGARVVMESQVPIRSGLSSSAALLVSWSKFLNEGFDLGYDQVGLAMVCYRAEHDELGIPCGMMDQISSSLGGIIRIDFKDQPLVRTLQAEIGELVVGDTMVHKRTVDVHGVRTKEMDNALAELRGLIGNPVDLKKVEWEEVQMYLSKMGRISAKRLKATILNRDITTRATDLLSKRHPDQEEVGRLLLEHQAHLRDEYEVSHPMIEKLIQAGLSAGALGGKLTGAGLGGFVVLLAPGRQKEVAGAIMDAGGRPYIVSVDVGARRE